MKDRNTHSAQCPVCFNEYEGTRKESIARQRGFESRVRQLVRRAKAKAKAKGTK